MASLALLAALACEAPPPVPGDWIEGEGFRWRALDVRRAATNAAEARAGFTPLDADRTGVTHRNDVDDARAMANRDLLIGAGAAVGDVDGDGYPDLFLASVLRPAALYRNRGDFRFDDVTRASGIRIDSLSTGATFADVDGDADLDLLVGTHGGPVMLWQNDGAGRFTDVTAISGLVGGYAATSLTLGDVDGDGDLDLYVATYKVRNALDAYPPQAREFNQVVTKTPEGWYVVRPEWAAEYRVEDRPDLGGVVRSQRADPDLFFVNDGTGRFVRTPIHGARFRDASGRPLASEPDFFTLAARFYDVNADGRPDLYVCNDFEDPDQFWINDGDGSFQLVPEVALGATSNTCMSVDFGDVNRDGAVDLFTADMLSPTLAAQQMEIPTHTPLPKGIGRAGVRPQWMRNMLHVARGDGTWAQVADYAGVAASDWTWGSAFLDVDLDGQEDLLALNGHRWDVRDADTFDRIRDAFPRVPWNEEQGQFPPLMTRSMIFRNNGDLTFRAMPDGWGLGTVEAVSHGLAMADFDLDGDLDLVVTRLNAAAVVHRNDATAPRVAVRAIGTGGNPFGIGAVVTVRGTAGVTQAREVTAGGYYLSGSEAQLVFAAPSDETFTIEVRWPDGYVTRVPAARGNRLYEVRQSAARSPVETRVDSGLPLFVDATALLDGHQHVEQPFDDFRRQPLLPTRLSQLGPGLAWLDADGDGDDDLVVGAGRGGSLALLRNEGERFRATPLTDPVRGDLTAIVPVGDGRGGVRLAVGQSSYEAPSADSALAMPRVLGVDVVGGRPAPRALVPGDTASIGAIASGDVDGDGWLDLFVAPRVIAGLWPAPAPSALWRGGPEGRFTRDVRNAAALRALGLVSSALLVDVVGDARPDLVVATEFGPVRVLRNDGGAFVDVTAALGLSGIRSRWNGLAAIDVDADGRVDLVVTSWGRNLPFGVSAERPHLLVTGPFGASGPGLVFARADSVTGREMPTESFARLSLELTDLRRRIATYREFAAADVDAVLGPAASAAVRIGATTYDHLLLHNRGSRFDAVPLPAAAQLAPAFGVGVADFDGDGREDLFLAQNFFPTEIATMRFDAGVGLVLRGDGTGGFTPLDVRGSGVAIRGDQRGVAVADFDADGRPDVAVAQNGEGTTLWRNQGGRPGQVVRLSGGVGNPLAVGAHIHIEGDGWRGPARVVAAGHGYWSTDAGALVLARPAGALRLVVRWATGRETRVPLPPGGTPMSLRSP
ncbi:MAG: VCBS repeat-containing protein [Gemmatimonadetes bacterium]|nr:VCBS repeat-containing protein [Gemmatimonadota bacterium]